MAGSSDGWEDWRISRGGLNVFVLDRMTWPEVASQLAAGNDLILVPVGAVEQHGFGITLGTDIYAADLVAERAAQDLNAFVAPVMPYGCSQAHMNFAGTASLQSSTLIAVLTDILTGLAHHGFQKLFVINGHGGNTDAVRVAVRDAKVRYPDRLFGSNLMWDSITESPDFKSMWQDVAPDMAERNLMGHGGIIEAAINWVRGDDTVRYDRLGEANALFDAGLVIRNEASSVSVVTNIEEYGAETGAFGAFAPFDRSLGERVVEMAGRKLAEDIRAAVDTFYRQREPSLSVN
jgi:creatinine amidohydrolase